MKKCCAVLMFVFAIIPSLTSPTFADDSDSTSKKQRAIKQIDPSGTWRWERDRDSGETIKNQLKIELKKDHKVQGTYYGLMDGLKSKTGTIAGNKLTLDFDVERDGNNFQVKFEAKIKGDKLAGDITMSGDEGSRDFPWKATRSVELSDVVGTWNLEIKTTEGEVAEQVLTVTEKNTAYTAKYTSLEHGDFDVTDLKAKNDKFTFTVTGEVDGSNIVAKFTTLPKGSKLSGGAVLKVDDETVELELSGKRKKKASKS